MDFAQASSSSAIRRPAGALGTDSKLVKRRFRCTGTPRAAQQSLRLVVRAPERSPVSMPRPSAFFSSSCFAPRLRYCGCKVNQRDSVRAEVEVLNPPREGKLESTRLKEHLRSQVQDAVEELGNRVTVGDVAGKAGVSVQEAEEALNALTADSLGSIQVSSSGDALYVLPSNFRSVISGRSWMLRIAPLIEGLKDGAAWLVRVGFGAALVTSVALVWITVFAILSSQSGGDRDDRDRGGYYGRGGYYPARRNSFILWDASDLLWFRSRRPPRYEHAPDQPMSFLESVFSFVFGDGDPNRDFEERRWQEVGSLIQSKGGVVTAEDLAPYLDPPDRAEGDEIDEAFVVPALVRFGGSPEVDENGNLLYRFESLQRSAGGRVKAPSEPAALQRLWEQTKAGGSQKGLAIALGVANLVGIAVLAGFLRQPEVLYSLARSSLGFMVNLMPILQVYAASFFLIPALRWILNQQRNSGLKVANQQRLERLRELREPTPRLKQKLLSAQRQANRTVVRDDDIVYRSDRAVDDQKRDLDADEFDRRLRESDGGGGQAYGDWAQVRPREVDADSEWRQRRR